MVIYRDIPIVLLFISFIGLSSCTTVADVRTTMLETSADKAYAKDDYSAAFAVYKKSAQRGGAYGQYMLANMYLSGEGTPSNRVEYLHWMRQSAENGYPPANYMMGMAYFSSDSKDSAQAMRYFEKAAQQEHGGAMHMLGLMRATGTGVSQDNREALRWFRMAHAHGIPIEPELLTESGVAAFSKQASTDSSLKTPTTNMVLEIQQGLKNLGYNPGPIDGIYGNKTKRGIKAFQRDAGMNPDGKPSQSVLDAIRSR